MDSYVREQLNKWKLRDLIPRFREEEVDEQAFRNLSPEIIRELIPRLGKRALFLAKYNQYVKQLQAEEQCDAVVYEQDVELEVINIEELSATSDHDPEECDTRGAEQETHNDGESDNGIVSHPLLTIEPLPSSSKRPSDDDNIERSAVSIQPIQSFTKQERKAGKRLRDLLNGRSDTARLLTKGFLQRKDRRLIADVIRRYLCRAGSSVQLTDEVLIVWSRAVELVFPTEFAAFYYRRDAKGEVQGKLVNRFTDFINDNTLQVWMDPQATNGNATL